MKIRQSVREVAAAKAGITVFLIAIIIGVVGYLFGVPLSVLVRDPAAEFNFPSYAGFFSYIGVGFMVATSAVAWLTAFVVRQLSGRYSFVLLTTSFFSLFLAIDDVFMLHESASRLGEVVFFACLGIVMGTILYLLFNERRDRDLRGLYWALGFLALSVFTDMFKIYGPFAYWLEDFSKLSGMAGWLVFWGGYSYTELMLTKGASYETGTAIAGNDINSINNCTQ